MICPKCQTPNRASAKFCDECGYELPSVAPVAHDMFDEEEVQTCEPKAAPTADLNGIDKTNDSSFSEYPIDNNNPEQTDIEGETVAFNPVDVNSLDDKLISEENNSQLNDFEQSEKDDFSLEITKVINIQNGENDDDFSTSNTQVMKKTSVDTGVMEKAESDGDVIYESRNYTTSANKTKKNMDPVLKRNLIIAISTIAIIAAILGITYFAQLWGGKTIPNVVGLTQVEATSKLSDAGFAVEVEEIMSDEVEGSVLATDPGAGERINEGATVKLQVAIRRTVPDILGLSEADARSLLEKNGFTNIEFVKSKSDETKGSVITTSPETGTKTTANTKLTVTIAEPFTVPDVTGLNKDAALAKLAEAGFDAKASTKFDETVDEGTVLSMSPEANAEVKSGSVVEIVVSEKKSTRMLNWTREFFNSTTRFSIDGVNYEMVGLKGVEYTSENVVYFNFQAKKYQTVTWFGSTSETRYGDVETIAGTVAWNENGDITAISPNIKQL